MNDNRTIYMPDGTPATELLTAAEAVVFLRLDTCQIKDPVETLRRYRDAGRLRGVQISRNIFYPLCELQGFIQRQLAGDPR